MEVIGVFYVIQASCVYDEYRYVMGCEGTEVEAYWEPNKLVVVSPVNYISLCWLLSLSEVLPLLHIP